jgi:hypothetical protein
MRLPSTTCRALHTQQEYLSVAEHLARLFRYS